MRLIFIPLFILFFLSCKTQKIGNDDAVIIIEKVIKLKGLNNGINNKDYSLNKSFLKLLYENVTFENGEYAEFGDLRNIIADSIINNVFNEFEFHNLISQLENSTQLKRSKKKNQILNVHANSNIKFDKKITFSLSNPIFCTKEPYALIMYSYGSGFYEVGRSGVILFKKTDNKWEFINEFWHTMP